MSFIHLVHFFPLSSDIIKAFLPWSQCDHKQKYKEVILSRYLIDYKTIQSMLMLKFLGCYNYKSNKIH